MSRFVDQYAPCELPGYPCLSIPTWSTTITKVASGDEQANQRWQHPLHTYVLPQAVRRYDAFLACQKHWYAMRGPLHSWPFRDPLDFASADLTSPNTVPTITALDQTIGTGDGVTTSFQLVKRYAVGNQTYDRKIYLPILSTVRVAVGGVEITNDSPSPDTNRQTGVVTLPTAPGVGVAVTAGFLFDVQVRFESDESFSGIVKSWGVAGFADMTLVEVRGPAE